MLLVWHNVPLFTAGNLITVLLYSQIHERLKSFEKRRPLPVQERAASLASDVSLNSLRRQDALLAVACTAKAKKFDMVWIFSSDRRRWIFCCTEVQGGWAFLPKCSWKKPLCPQGWLLKATLDGCHFESALTKKAVKNINISPHSCD